MLLALAGVLPAQGDDALRATLEPASKVIASGASAVFTLRVECLKDTKVPATVLSGVLLETVVEGDTAEKTIGKGVSGEVSLAAGTTIVRHLDVDLGVTTSESTALKRLTVSWPELPGATASMQVAPDQSKIDIDKLDLSKTRVVLMTDYGQITIRFLAREAPNHARNFIELSKDGFYDGTRFHRVIRNFMIQGGCPNTKEGATGIPGTGSRPDGKMLKAELSDHRHVRGTVSMARGSDLNSASCQFFLVHGDAPHLDGKYSAFGEIESGLDTLDKIANVPVKASATGEASVPRRPVHLYKAIVLPVYKES